MNDIALVARSLEKTNFKVTRVENADYRAVDTAIKRHIQAVRRAGEGAVSLFYYSGHGAADPETRINYLNPVDVTSADDADLWTNSIDLNAIVSALRAQAANATHYVVFDACRNELNLTRKGTKALSDKGFQPISYTPGVMIAYATAPGQTASDIGRDSGPYAQALADEMIKPGVEALTMFRNVALRVNREIGQDPWLSASTLPVVYFAGEAPAPVAQDGRPPQIVAMLEKCVTAERHPLAGEIAQRFASRFNLGAYGYGWPTTASQAIGGDALHRITNAEARDDELRLSYDYQQGRLLLIPIVARGATRGAPPGVSSQGIWLQNNGASCLSFAFDEDADKGEGRAASTGSTETVNPTFLRRLGADGTPRQQ